MAFHEIPSTDQVPYFPFPEAPQIIRVGKFEVYDYVTPDQMRKCFEALEEKVKLDQYEAVLVNLNGGTFLFKAFSMYQWNAHKPVEPVAIEYHRPENGYDAIVVKPVPKEYKDKKVLVLDDIYDSGGVLGAIMKEVGPQSQAVALVTKNGIPNQIKIPNLIIGMRIDNKWVGGGGMDLGVPEEGNTFRNYPGLVVKI